MQHLTEKIYKKRGEKYSNNNFQKKKKHNSDDNNDKQILTEEHIYLYIFVYCHIYTHIYVTQSFFFTTTKLHYLVGCMPLQSCIVTHYKNSKNLYKAESNSLLYIFFIPKNGGKESANLNLLLFKKLATCRPKKQGKLAPSKFLLFFFVITGQRFIRVIIIYLFLLFVVVL